MSQPLVILKRARWRCWWGLPHQWLSNVMAIGATAIALPVCQRCGRAGQIRIAVGTLPPATP